MLRRNKEYIQAIIVGAGNQIRIEKLIPAKDDKTKEHFLFNSTKQPAGKFDNKYIYTDDNGTRWIHLYMNNGKYCAYKPKSKKALEYVVPHRSEYASQRVDKFAQGIDTQGFWEKHGQTFLITAATFFLMLGQAIDFWRKKKEADADILLANAVRGLTKIVNQSAGLPPIP